MAERDGSGERRTVRVSSPSHRVRVVAEERTDIVVDGTATSRQVGSVLSVEEVHGSLVVRAPLGTDVQVGTESARIEVSGSVGRLAATSSSGRIMVESAETADIRTASGRIEVGSVAGEARLRTTSGRVVVGSCAGLDVATESGRIAVHDARGAIDASCVSGEVEVEMAAAADVSAETVSGRIDVTLPAGTKVYRPDHDDRSGAIPPECDCTVTARTVTGRVVVGER